jgi:hypothetical protein
MSGESALIKVNVMTEMTMTLAIAEVNIFVAQIVCDFTSLEEVFSQKRRKTPKQLTI